ncbi:transposase [Rubinisphaera italica]|uniref:Transposase IS200 like protein n=1 Tax=Rubinisphaera italica TaxID=2527969 RepID=A0A5C5XNM9_9PLAN|nr:Transposase IS200 like protein [Rubinisphaera italica]
MAVSEMKESPFILNGDDRKTVGQTIQRHCEIRKWQLFALSVRTNHVHVVVTAPGYEPLTISHQFKAWCSRKLKSTQKNRQRFWTEGASRRFLNNTNQLESAVKYVLEAQDRRH